MILIFNQQARATQEAEMQKLIKEAEKPRKVPSMSNFASTSSQMPNLTNFNTFNPFPALTNLQALHQLSTRSPPAPPITRVPYKSPSSSLTNETAAASGVSPLDLSSSSTPPLAKRIKLSPSSTETKQQATSPANVTTTGSGSSTTSSSSSTTSNNSEQAIASNQSPPSPQKCQIKIDEINAWNVDDVCSFVESIAICAEYVKVSFFMYLSLSIHENFVHHQQPPTTATAEG